MQHIVITRFNVKGEETSHAPPDAWLRERLGLFQRFLLPSMACQDATINRWLLFCDAGSPAWLNAELASAIDGIPGAELVWIEGSFWSEIPGQVAARCSSSDDLITTRVDNDDAIACDYLRRVQEVAAGVTDAFVNFTHGAQLHGARVYRRSDPANAFISLVEKASSAPRTVFVDQHQRLGLHGRVVQVKTDPLWLQVVHTGNVANSVRGIRTSAPAVLARFAVDVVPSETRSEIVCDAILTGVRTAFRVVAAPHRMRWALKLLGARRQR